MNLGVVGGTFDPVHLAHLAVAERAARQVPLDEVLFVPAGHPYFKDPGGISPADDRIAMLELALKGHKTFKISLLEVQREGPSYAIDTLAELQAQRGPQAVLYFILGWDSVLSLPLWREPQKLLALCRIVAAPRPGFPAPQPGDLEAKLPGISRALTILEGPNLDISSSDIRRRVRQGLPIDHLVPKSVARYIRRRRLYQG